MPTLYITQKDGILGRKGEALCWRPERKSPSQIVPLSQVEDVVVLGQGNVTTQALHSLMEANVPVHYVDAAGRYKGSLTSGRGRGYVIRRLQYEAADNPEMCLTLALGVTTGKLLGQRSTLLRYFYRSKRSSPALREAGLELSRLSRAVPYQKDIEALRGIEGIGAMRYFTALSELFEPPWVFQKRNRRPPRDPVNALLSFGYTLLLSSVSTAVILAGLDPCVGFMHPEYRGRPSLALDMMEEFRSPVIDRMVIAACNQGFFKTEDFARVEDNEGVTMSTLAKKTLLKLYDTRLRTNAKNMSTEERSSFGHHIHTQAEKLARCLRLQAKYLPFICAN